jgi:type I restriction enzyme S subunit
MARLGDCCDVKSGATPKTDIEKYWGGEIRWATPKDISRIENPYLFDTPDKITAEGYQSCSTQLLPVGTVLVSSRAPIGLVAIAGVEMCTNQGFKNLVPGPDVHSNFLYHCMKANSGRLTALGNGATFKEVSKSIVENFQIPLPPVQEQLRIAAILDKADSLCRKRQDAIRLVDEFLKAIFYDRFGDPVANPKGLPTSRVDLLCEVATGSTPARNRSHYYDGPNPWIKTGEVDSPLIMAAEEHISDEAIRETNCKLFPIGTLLIAMYGQGKTRGKVGMLGIPAATNQACAAILPSQNIDRQFLHTQLTLMYEHLRAMGRGGNQENLNLGMIKSLEVLIPPSHLVDEFIRIRHRVTEMMSKARCAQAESTAMLQSLAAKFFD